MFYRTHNQLCMPQSVLRVLGIYNFGSGFNQIKVKKDQGNKNWKTLCKIIQEWWTKLRDEQLPLLAAYHNEVKNLLKVAFVFS